MQLLHLEVSIDWCEVLRYLEEGQDCPLTEPGGETESESVETEGDCLAGLVLLTAGHLGPAEEAAGAAQPHHQPVLQAGTLRPAVEDKQGEHEEAQPGHQAGAPGRHHQVPRAGG